MLKSIIRNIFYPKPVVRDSLWRANNKDKMSQLVLNMKAGCPYCFFVQREVHRLGLDISIEDIGQSAEKRTEQIQGGGKGQVPCLRIIKEDKSIIWMYESDLINKYVQKEFPT